jgi:hypothetical protein
MKTPLFLSILQKSVLKNLLSKDIEFFNLANSLKHHPVNLFRLVFNETTLISANAPGVETRTPGFGGTDSVEWLDPSKASQGNYFSPIVEALTAWGYKRGKTVLGAPFDWRRAPRKAEFVLEFCVTF